MRVGLGIVLFLYNLKTERLFWFFLFSGESRLLLLLFYWIWLKFLTNCISYFIISLTYNPHILHFSLLLFHTLKLIPCTPFTFSNKIKHLWLLRITISLSCLFIMCIRIYIHRSKLYYIKRFVFNARTFLNKEYRTFAR